MKQIILILFLFSISISAQNLSELDLKIEDTQNNKVVLSSLFGKGPVYINFWALWCVPCRSELKPLNSLYEKYKSRGFDIVSINIDNIKSAAKINSFLASQKFTFNVYLDPESRVFKMLSGDNLPYSLLINKDGKVEKIRTGYYPGDEKEIEKEIETLLNNN